MNTLRTVALRMNFQILRRIACIAAIEYNLLSKKYPKNIQKDSKRKGGTSWFSAAGQSDSAIDAANLALGQERERESN